MLRGVSRVVPGLVYYWGIYVPPGTSDVDFRSVVAMRGRQAVPTRDAGGWSRATKPWEAASAEDALTACQEIVHVTRERFFPLVAPQVYRGPGSLRDGSVRNVQELEAKLSLPSIENKGGHGSWTARFWVVGAINVVQYQCDVAPQAASVHELQTLQGYVERTVF